MHSIDFKNLITQLSENGVTLEEGLSEAELSNIERDCYFQFPPDLRTFLQHALPIKCDFPNYRGDLLTDYFPNWRLNPRAIMATYQHRLLNGILFDIEVNGFWLAKWGKQPSQISEALAQVKERFLNAPLLIPVYKHRYISSKPQLTGNPVFSISQTDIVRYGNDLFDYFHRQFGVDDPAWDTEQPRRIDFWDDIIDHHMMK